MFVTLQLTEKCNFDCVYCFQGEKDERSISLEEGQERIDFIFASYHDLQAKKAEMARGGGAEEGEQSQQSQQSQESEATEPESLLISFYGGEPLLEFALIKELFAYAEKKAREEAIPCRYMMISNGYLLNDEHIQFLKEHEDQFDLKFSLDGQQKTHDQQRLTVSGQPTFERVLANIQRFHAEVKPTRIAMVVTPQSVPNLMENILYLTELGFNDLEFEIDSYALWEDEHVQDLEAELSAVMAHYLDQLAADPDYKIAMFDSWMRPLVNKSDSCLKCGAGRQLYYINVQGDIYTCPLGDKLDSCHFGHVHTGFTENVDLIPQIKEEDLQSECLSCANKNTCFLTCIAQNERLSQNIYKMHPIQCQRGQLGVKLGIRFGNQFYQRYPDLFRKRFLKEEVLECS